MDEPDFENLLSVTAPASSLSSESEEALWMAFKEGSSQAFDTLYKTHIQSLIHYGYKVTNNRSLIQDSIQDLFVELWQSRSTLAQAHSVRPYLLKSLRYKIIRSLQTEVGQPLDGADIPDDSNTIEHLILQGEDSLRHSLQLGAALLQLPRRQKEAIHLRYFQGFSNEEVAQIMGVNYQSACKFIYTALRTLRKKLQLASLLIPLFLIMGEI